MLQDLHDRYASSQPDSAFGRLYEMHDPNDRMFAILHQRLDGHFDFMNHKAA